MYQDFENITIGNGGNSKLPPKKTIIQKIILIREQ